MTNHSVGFINSDLGIMDVVRVIERNFCTFTSLENTAISNFYILKFEIENMYYELNIFEKYQDEEITNESDPVTYLTIARHGNSYDILRTVIMNYGGKIKVDEGLSKQWEVLEQRESRILNMKISNNKELKVSFI